VVQEEKLVPLVPRGKGGNQELKGNLEIPDLKDPPGLQGLQEIQAQ
jgi:hypothetical protein